MPKYRDFNVTRYVIPFQDESRTQGCDAITGLQEWTRDVVIDIGNLITRLDRGRMN